jgi:catechol 2,3-dioxygenase-like lactoylglutathione lyase family enzyme
MRYDHSAFEVADLAVAIRFYVDRLGFKEIWRHRNEQQAEECAFLMVGDLRLELLVQLGDHKYQRPEIEPPYCPHLAIAVDDLDQAIARLNEQGVPILRGPLLVADKVRWLYFADPDNNVIEYVQWLERD